MNKIDILDADLKLFDGAAGDGGGAAEGAGGQAGEAQAGPASTRQGKTGEAQEDGSLDAGEGKDRAPEERALEERRRAFRSLVNGEYKDLFTEETQRIINRRFRETRELEQTVNKHQPVLDMLMRRYHIDDGDIDKLAAAVENDDLYWAEEAEQAGMSVEQYKQLDRLQRENEALRREEQARKGRQAAQRQLEQWYGEAEEMKADYPDFDLSAEAQEPQFLSMLRAGVPMKHAYEVLHMDAIKENVARLAAQAAEKQVVDGIRSKGARPLENGTSGQSAFTVKDDVSKLTRKDRAEIARRAARGERISFGL